VQVSHQHKVHTLEIASTLSVVVVLRANYLYDSGTVASHCCHCSSSCIHCHCADTAAASAITALPLPQPQQRQQARLLYAQGTKASLLMPHALCRSLALTSTQLMAPLHSVISVWSCLIRAQLEPLEQFKAVGDSALSALCKVTYYS
jgi:hypothetical protein